MFREYTELPWSENIKFRLDPLESWEYTESKYDRRRVGGQKKGTGRLQVFGIDNAGHIAAGDQKEGVSSVVREWLQTRT